MGLKYSSWLYCVYNAHSPRISLPLGDTLLPTNVCDIVKVLENAYYFDLYCENCFVLIQNTLLHLRYFILLTKTYPKKMAKHLCLPDTCGTQQKLPVTVTNTNSLEARKSILILNLTHFSLCSVGYLVWPKADYHLRKRRGGNLHLSWLVRTKGHWLRPPYPSGPAYAPAFPGFSACFLLFMQFRASVHRTVQPSVKVKLPTSTA